jgi:hypothetical protein
MPKRSGLRSDACLSRKDGQERTQRRERNREIWHEWFRREARQSPEHLPIGPTALELAAIDAYSTAIADRIISYLRNAPIELCLIRGGNDNGKANQCKRRFAPIVLTSFAQLLGALNQSQARDQT